MTLEIDILRSLGLEPETGHLPLVREWRRRYENQSEADFERHAVYSRQGGMTAPAIARDARTERARRKKYSYRAHILVCKKWAGLLFNESTRLRVEPEAEARPGPDQGPKRSGPKRSGQKRSGPERSGPERSGPERFGPTAHAAYGPEQAGPAAFQDELAFLEAYYLRAGVWPMLEERFPEVFGMGSMAVVTEFSSRYGISHKWHPAEAIHPLRSAGGRVRDVAFVSRFEHEGERFILCNIHRERPGSRLVARGEGGLLEMPTGDTLDYVIENRVFRDRDRDSGRAGGRDWVRRSGAATGSSANPGTGASARAGHGPGHGMGRGPDRREDGREDDREDGRGDGKANAARHLSPCPKGQGGPEEVPADRFGLAARYESPVRLFCVFRPFNRRIRDFNEALGVPVYHDATDMLAEIDELYDIKQIDIQTSRRTIFIDKDALTYHDGKANIPQHLYATIVATAALEGVGGALKPAPITEFAPTPHAPLYSRELQAALNRFSDSVGLGPDAFRPERGGPATATQILSENQEKYANLKKHLGVLSAEFTAFNRAILQVARMGGEEHLDPAAPIGFFVRDGVLTDEETERRQALAEVEAGLMSREYYLEHCRGLSGRELDREIKRLGGGDIERLAGGDGSGETA